MPRSSLLLVLAALACAKADTPPVDTTASVTPTAAPNVVTIVARDFAYDAPDTIPAGMTTLRFVNAGPGLHHVTLVRLHEGKTYADLEAAFKSLTPTSPPPTWLTFEGGPQPGAAGDTTEVTQPLEAGAYALVCFVDVPAHVPHFAKGMSRSLTVAPSAASAAAPAADVTIGMTDYAWDIKPALTAGTHILKVSNTAAQPHEFFIMKLDEGRTPEDLGKWAATFEGPPPGVPAGGIASIRPGADAWVRLKLTPGNYVMLCFLPDAKDGKPHLNHGMVMPFTIS